MVARDSHFVFGRNRHGAKIADAGVLLVHSPAETSKESYKIAEALKPELAVRINQTLQGGVRRDHVYTPC
jgi:hypothetical protein